MNERSDQNLLMDSCTEDRQARAELVQRHYRRIVGLCLAMVGDMHTAQDLAQETMLRAFKNMHRLQDRACFGVWIVKIAKNLCTDHIRKKQRTKETVLSQEPICAPQTDRYDEIRQTVKRLPMELRIPLLMYYFDGKNTAAISEHLQISAVTVCRRLRAAKEELSKLLTEQE